MTKEKIFCKICSEQTKYTTDNFSNYHLRKIHHMDAKQYYDMYMKKETEGKCKICQKNTNYDNWTLGYRKYCSYTCANIDPDIAEKIRCSHLKKDHTISSEKRRNTCLTKYGHEFASQVNEIKEKSKKTCLEKYGCSHTLNLPLCKDKRLEILQTKKDEINEKRKSWWNDESIASTNLTRKITLLEKYNVDNSFDIPGIREKIKEKCLKKYGAELVVESKYFRKCMIDQKAWLPTELHKPFRRYWMDVQNLTNSKKEDLFNSWNGRCYYTGIKIKENICIDHKISRIYGFINSIPVEEIGNINNLAITFRSLNSCKNGLTEEEFITSSRYQDFLKRLYG